MLDLNPDCTDCSVCDIKVQPERIDSIFEIFVLMSNKSCCFAFLFKAVFAVVSYTATVVKAGLIFFLSYHSVFTAISLSTLFKCG